MPAPPDDHKIGPALPAGAIDINTDLNAVLTPTRSQARMATDMEPQANPQHTKRWITAIFLGLLTLVALYFCFIIARPFLTSILWALIIAVPFHPVHDRLHRVIRNKSAAALVSVLIVILIVVIPAFLLGMATINELKNAYQSVSEKSAAGGGWTQYFNDMTDSASDWVGAHIGAS